MLFGLDMTGQGPVESLDLTHEVVEGIDDEIIDVWDLVEWRVEGICESIEAIDEAVQAVSPRWRVERMSVVDRNLLRIGAWELMESDIPAIVTINACVELAKEYGEESTPGFVNGLLDELCSDRGIEVA